MDKKRYYRVLGLQEDATSAQIKTAYAARTARLKSLDYADDPEYVQRKMAEARYAYSVLMGTAPPVTKEQRERRFEEFKDHVDAGCFEEKRCRLDGRKKKTADFSFSAAKAKGAFETVKGKFDMGPDGKAVLGIIAAILISIVSAAVSGCNAMNSVEIGEPVYSVEQMEYQEIAQMQVNRILERNQEYDYYGWLDGADPVPADKIEWEFSDETNGNIWGRTMDLCDALGIIFVEEAVHYWTGDSQYYWNSTDYGVSVAIAEIMGAPYFEEIAGLQNIYSGDYIVTYDDYMYFLLCVADNQTYELCGEPVEF